MISFSLPSFAAQSAATAFPLSFEQNAGQATDEVRYLTRAGALLGEFEQDGVRLKLSGHGNAAQVKMRLVGARGDAAMTGGGSLEGQTNYLLGNDPAHWLRGLLNYSEVRYSQVYPGTDLVFYGNGGKLEHDFEVQPGADPAHIAFRMDGAKSVTLVENGDLRIGLAAAAIDFERPVAYQVIAGARHKVDADFTIAHDGTVRFRLGDYDRAEKLVIDPVLSFATYLSAFASDANYIATDATGNNYVSGNASLGFPVTAKAFAGCPGCTANTNVTFISKLSPDGKKLIYSTVLGGNQGAQPTGIAVDGSGNVLVSGWTSSSNFPTRKGQPISPPGNGSGFLVSLSADGSSLNYGTMLESTNYATAVAVDSSGNAYVTGDADNQFPTTPGALTQTASNSYGFNVFLAKFSPDGTLIYSAVLGNADPQNGGGGPIGSVALSVDAAGDAFVTGQAGSLWPISSNAYLKQIAGPNPYATPFVMKVAPDAKSFIYSTYLDYAGEVTGIAALSNGNVLVAGNQVGASYPTTPDAYQQNSGRGGGAFLTELNSTGSSLTYSTVIGDRSYSINGLALDADGAIWLAAQTTNTGFPLVDPIQAIFPVSGPVSMVNEFDPSGRTLKFSTFLGGDAEGFASGIAIDANHKAHVAGAAEYGMYTTPGVYAGSVPMPSAGLSEQTFAYVALIDPSGSTGALCLGDSAVTGLSFGVLLPQTTASQNVQLSNCGAAPLSFTSIAASDAAFTVPAGTNGCTGVLAVGGSCTLSVVFKPTAPVSYSAQLTFSSNASLAASAIPLSGSGGEPSAGFGPVGVTKTLQFSPLLVGQTSSAAYIPLYNNGTVPLTIFKIAVTSGFALAPGGNCPGTLPAHQLCSLYVDFAPTAAGNITGTLSLSSNDPLNPTISTSLSGTAFTSYPLATITGLLNPSYPVNGGTSPITMSVFGTNFFAGSVVYIHGVAQSTDYESGTFLRVTFNPSVVNVVGDIPVTVVNPAPGGGSSASYPLIGYLPIPLTASALTVNPVSSLLYAAIPSSASKNPNTVVPINPASGALMTPIAVAADPQALAVSDDGSELYVASAGVLQRVNLNTLAIERTFSLPVDRQLGQTNVREMHVVPGSPQSVVVELIAALGSSEDGAALYNDSGLVNWISSWGQNQNTLSIASFTFTSPANIYALPWTGSFFTPLQVTTGGISGSGGSGGGLDEQTGSLVRSDGSLLYTNSGEVWDPSTQKLSGTYLELSGSQLFYAPSVVPDTANGHTYFLNGEQYEQNQSLDIDIYDQASYALQGVVPFTTIYSPEATDLVRWGTNGFAFRCVDITASDPSANQIVIVTSDLVKPSNIAPIPILASVTPATVYARGPAYIMQLTGSGFTSASTVLIDGSSRLTTYISGTSLSAQVEASDIAGSSQLGVQVATPGPGGGISDYVSVAVNLPPPTTPSLTLTPSATAINTAQALTIRVGVSGMPTATGSVTLTGGGFTSAATVLSGGSATIGIAAGLLAIGSDNLTADYMPDYASSSTYNSSTGSTTISVTEAAAMAALQFVPVTPCRVADTRDSAGPFGGPSLAAAATRGFDIPGSTCGIPSAAAAYSLNVTVVPAGELGYLTLWPAGQAQPEVSTLNSLDGRIKANAAITPAGTNGGVDVYVSEATNVILDIDGYFVPKGTANALSFYPLNPCRIADTRVAAGTLGGPSLSATSSRSFPVQSSGCNIPVVAQAYSLNVTAIPHTRLDYLTTWPTGESQPNVSTLNALTGAITANAAIVPAGDSASTGAVSIYVSDAADVVIDINGYFAPPANGGLSLYTTNPCRALDTRNGTGAFNGFLAIDVQASGCAPPSTTQGYVLNATVVPPATLTYLTLWSDGVTQPDASTLNALDGAITSNMSIVPTDNGSIYTYASNQTQLILDLTSYFAP